MTVFENRDTRLPVQVHYRRSIDAGPRVGRKIDFPIGAVRADKGIGGGELRVHLDRRIFHGDARRLAAAPNVDQVLVGPGAPEPDPVAPRRPTHCETVVLSADDRIAHEVLLARAELTGVEPRLSLFEHAKITIPVGKQKSDRAPKLVTSTLGHRAGGHTGTALRHVVAAGDKLQLLELVEVEEDGTISTPAENDTSNLYAVEDEVVLCSAGPLTPHLTLIGTVRITDVDSREQHPGHLRQQRPAVAAGRDLVELYSGHCRSRREFALVE